MMKNLRDESEIKYEFLFENSSFLIQNVSKDGKILHVNNAWCRLLGYSKEEALNLNLKDILHPSCMEHCMQLFKQVISGKSVKNIEAKFVSKSNKIINVLGSAQPLIIKGEFVSTYGIFKDVRDFTLKGIELEKLTELFKTISNNSVDAIFSKDADKKYTFVNKGMEEITGLKTEQLIGKTPDEIYDKILASQVNKIDLLCFKGEHINEIVKVLSHDKEYYLHVIQSPIRSNGRIIGSAGIVRNITKQKEYEKKLSNYLNELNIIFKNSPTGIIFVDSEHNILNANPEFCKKIGYSLAELKKMTYKDITYKDDLKKSNEQVKKLKEKVITEINLESRFVRKDKRIIWAKVNVSKVNDSFGKLIYNVVSFEDITKKIIYEKKLAEEKQWSEQLIKSAPNIVIGLGKNFEIMLFNEFAEKLTGYKSSEVIGKNWMRFFIQGAVKKDLYKLWDKLVRNKLANNTFENIIITKSGQKKLISWNNSLIEKEGKFKMILSIGEDITKQRESEKFLQSSQKMLSTTFSAMDDLVFVFDKDGKFIFYNAVSESLFLTPSKFLGKKLTKVMPKSISKLFRHCRNPQ
ncbi:MAG: PAS domain S-box protein [Candidatus Nanoarchaeia archaeon]|nr:PAS domain S-box protein [Candidatus Nanoarchaeia archaeon]